MDTKELLKKVRKIEIKTKNLSNQIFSGEYHSAFKGKGMAFSEVREYMPGDDIRTIDWNVTARYNHPYVKVFEEERELTVMLLVDISGSEIFGSGKQLKKEIIAEISAVLAFSASQNNDKIGALLFTDKIELFIPPKKGKKHILRIIRELIEFKPSNTKTNIDLAFLISYFLDDGYEKSMKIARKKHDLVALRIYDNREKELPNIGIAQLRDSETGIIKWLNTSSKKNRLKYRNNAIRREHETLEIFRKSNVDFANINIHQEYIKPLMNVFKKR
jgi:uncharacterized protein (DUF58 family)